MRRIILFILLGGLLVSGCSSPNHQIKVHQNVPIETQHISVLDVKEIVDNYSDYENVDIIDVRSDAEFHEGHIVGAINIPLELIEKIDIPRDRKLIVYCQTGRRSNLAVSTLQKLGYENVFDMGGIENWPYDVVK